jgi:DsbC/DsbD-like thiol-disulfide interchange protein
MKQVVSRFVSGAALFLAIAGPAGAQTSPQAAVSPLKKLEVLTDKDGVKAGGEIRLAVRVTLDREFHVNSHVPSAEFLIPTSLELTSLEGMVQGEWEFPKGEMRTFPFSQDPLSVYEGTFLILGSLKAPGETQPAEKQIKGFLRYQACTSQRCYPPKKEEFTFQVHIVAPDTPVQAIHPELFHSL